MVKKAKVDAKAKIKGEKIKSARQTERLADAAANRKKKDEDKAKRDKLISQRAQQKEQDRREKNKDAKRLKKVQKKAAAAQSAADAQKAKTAKYASGMSSGSMTSSSSTGEGTGLSDTVGAVASNAGTAIKRTASGVATIGSAIRAKQKQNKADKLAKKAKKKEKKFDKKYNEEVFYDWREEFLHEVEKRGDKKEKKVIDVMRGKNQVEFNPVTEANVSEDMSGMSQKSGDKRPTDKGAGMTAKGVAKYNRRTGGNLKTAVTTPPSKLDPDSKAAKRRKSFCARSKGWTGERGKAARRRWNC